MWRLTFLLVIFYPFYAISLCYSAKIDPQEFELVYTAPIDTILQNPTLSQTQAVWLQMFSQAQQQIDIAQFYVQNQPVSRLDPILNALELAGKRGVHIRFLLDKQGKRLSDQATLQRLAQIPNLELKFLNYAQLGGGVLHAKYFIIDQQQAFMGSQNFDWRSLEHIHELGLRIRNPEIVQQIQQIFELDWTWQNDITHGQTPNRLPLSRRSPSKQTHAYLLASPPHYTPDNIILARHQFAKILAQAKRHISIQLLTYRPSIHTHKQKDIHYYPLFDNALREAATRGVYIQLMVSSWNTKTQDLTYLKSLAALPNIAIKIVTLPTAQTGFIPFARVIHSKIMVIDQQHLWLGTSNWQGEYFEQSRNLEIMLDNPPLAEQAQQLYQQLWHSPYAQLLKADSQFSPPHPWRP